MKYRHKFIKKVKTEFFNNPEVYRLLEEGSVFLGNFLKKHSKLAITPEEVVFSFEAGDEVTLLEKAEKAIRIKNLYEDWLVQYKRALRNGKTYRFDEGVHLPINFSATW